VGAVQALVLGVGWYFLFHTTYEQIAEGVEALIVESNERMARSLMEAIGVVHGDLEFGAPEWERTQTLVEGVELPNGGFVCVLDKDGRILCHPEIRQNPGLRDINLSGHMFSEFGKEDEAPLEAFGKSDVSSGTMRFLFDGKHYVATQLFPDAEERLIVHQPVSGLTAASRHLTRGLILQSLIVGLLVVGLTVFVVGMVTQAHHRSLLQWNEQLDERVRERTRELRVALGRAEEATRLKARFLDNMSHEIRTPMNGILGMIQVLEGTKLSADQRGVVRDIAVSGDSLVRTLTSVLEYSRISASDTAIDERPFELRPLAEAALAPARRTAFEKELELELTIDGELPQWLVGDAPRLRQVLENLVDNGVKFTHRGRVTLRITKLNAGGGAPLEVLFEVEDTGIGIDPAQRERIFETFEQADTSSTRAHGGTGLGLAIARETVHQLGSDLELESEPARGSVFRFVLALVPVAPPRGPVDEAPSLVVPPAPLPEELTVLVVEDNPVNQRVAARLLESLGCEVRLAEHGLAALELLEREPVSLVFMDCQMPVLDGYETTRRIRAHRNPAIARLPIAALTAHARGEDERKAFDAGMDAYLTKPVTKGSLLRVVNEVRSTGRLRRVQA